MVNWNFKVGYLLLHYFPSSFSCSRWSKVLGVGGGGGGHGEGLSVGLPLWGDLEPGQHVLWGRNRVWDSRVVSTISLTEVTEVVEQQLSDKVPRVNEIHPEVLEALDIVGLSWLAHLFNATWRSRTLPVDWQTWVVVFIFQKGDGGDAPTVRVSHYSASQEKFEPGLQFRGQGSLLERGGLSPLGCGWVSAPSEEVQVSQGLLHEWG